MHQPLHSANNQDRGGNEVAVQFHGKPRTSTPYGTAVFWAVSALRPCGSRD
jgi:hypothetical protein